MPRATSERGLVFVVGAVQFVNILDFMIVMPLGPDFAEALGIPNSQLGLVGGSYTAAAAVSGFLGSFFLDRFGRRAALSVALLGLVLGTAIGGLATGLPTLMAARVVAGAFGGPATSISLSIVADVIPPERRGKALGAVMGAFAAASVLGVPLGLELARLSSWRAPFFAVAALGVVIDLAAVSLLPPLTGHLQRRSRHTGAWSGLLEMVRRPTVMLAYVMMAVTFMSNFVLIPNISAYVQNNLGFPRERLGVLYLAGGAVTFFALRIAGRLVDRWGSFRVGTVATAVMVAVVYLGFYLPEPPVSIILIFVVFMVSSSFRGVPLNTLSSRIPAPEERARFSSIQSSVQHISAATGAVMSSRLLGELPGGRLHGMASVAVVSMALGALMPCLLWLVESRVLHAARAERAPA